jgi:hypothetical protein
MEDGWTQLVQCLWRMVLTMIVVGWARNEVKRLHKSHEAQTAVMHDAGSSAPAGQRVSPDADISGFGHLYDVDTRNVSE